MNTLRRIFCKIYLGISGDSIHQSPVIARDNLPLEDFYKKRGKPSSELIFRSDYFQLIGNDPLKSYLLSVPWYPEMIISYCERTRDPNMIAALKKITSSINTDEALRHRAAGLIDMLEDNKTPSGILKKGTEAAKIQNALLLLAGSRTPQTTEILRLLRDKSTASKRSAILMIGKFRLADLAGEVCDCLPVTALCRVAADVLQSFGSAVSSDLMRLYMNQSGNRETGRIIVTLLGNTSSKSDDEFIFSLLQSNIREIRFLAARLLRVNSFTAEGERAMVVNRLISESIRVITWTLSSAEHLDRIGKKTLTPLLEAEISDWKLFIINLLSLVVEKSVIEGIESNQIKRSLASSCYAGELIEKCTHESVREGLINLFDGINRHLMLKGLKRQWPVSLNGNILEEIINRDYNLLNSWTKATALRDLDIGQDERAAESVMALLFSPMALLREEAALALKRSERPVPEELLSRLPVDYIDSIRKIIRGNGNDHEFFYFRVTFLSGLFPGIPPEELIILAGSLNYYSNEKLSYHDIVNSIAWEIDINRNVRRCVLIIDEINMNSIFPDGIKELIVLSLDALDNFLLLNHERASEIYDYLDRNAIVSGSD